MELIGGREYRVRLAGDGEPEQVIVGVVVGLHEGETIEVNPGEYPDGTVLIDGQPEEGGPPAVHEMAVEWIIPDEPEPAPA